MYILFGIGTEVSQILICKWLNLPQIAMNCPTETFPTEALHQ